MRKLFEHSLVNQVNLECETTEKGRVYITPKGHKLKSVTTILDKTLDKTWLWEWRHRIGIQEANRISAQATKRGTIIHGMAEKYLLNKETYLENTMPVHSMAFEAIKKVLDCYVETVYAVEIPVYSLALQTAGRVDCIAKFGGVLSVIDFKTSRKPKTESQIHSYFLQATCYALMFEQMYKAPVERIVIIMAVEDEPEALVFIKNRYPYISEVLKIFNGE